VKHFAPLFDYDHLPSHLARISKNFADCAQLAVDSIPDSPELAACLRKVIEAKDCAVRGAVGS
jgi:hypothetical protein